MHSPYTNAVHQLNSIRDTVGISDELFQRLITPDRVIEKGLQIRMESGEERTFTAFRSQHNNSRGAYKGGIRFHPGVTKDEVMALSMWMSWKTAMLDLPLGGGKGGIIVDPKELSEAELEQLSRAYAREFSHYFGENIDIPAPDMNTNGQIMSWMLDEYEKTKGHSESGAFTGKPLEIGGSLGRIEATGFGGEIVLESYLKRVGEFRAGMSVAIQGYGNVGYWFAKRAADAGFRIVGIGDSKGSIFRADGFDPDKVLECKESNGSLIGYSDELGGVEELSAEEILYLDVDILVPAALENSIHQDNVKGVKARYILELANGPTTPEAEVELLSRGTVLLPDILANAGGVTVSYFEWVQNRSGYKWELEEVNEKLRKLLERAVGAMVDTMSEKSVDSRVAAYIIAVSRVAKAMELRGRRRV